MYLNKMCADSVGDTIDIIESLKERVEELECNTHPPREFIVCKKCNQKIKEK